MGVANSASPSTVVLAAGATLLAASLGLGFLAMTSANNKKQFGTPSESRALATVTEIDDEDHQDQGDFITESDVCKIFDQLFTELQNAFSQLMNQVQQLQMAGQRIPEQQLQIIMKQELERALRMKQGPIVEMAGLDMDCFEEATWEFIDQKNTKVQTAVERIQKLWQTATGELVVGWKPGKELVMSEPLGPDETVVAATAYFKALTECMRRLIQEYEIQEKDLQSPAVQQQLNLDFGTQANEAGEAALEHLGYSQAQFEASVAAHKDNNDVARALTMLSMQQQQDFATMRS
jgi:hypothetical protein